jgi:ketosteroid isomerase-like protein
MRRLLFAATLLVSASTLALAQTAQGAMSQPAGPQAGSAEQAVATRVQEFRDALRKADEAALNSIYADDYSITNDTGGVQTKAERLSWVKANTARLSGLDFQDLKTRVYGDAAVVTGRATSTTDGLNSRMIQVWVRQGGAWRLVAGQTTAIVPAQPAEKKP